jgi:hypothetical protein
MWILSLESFKKTFRVVLAYRRIPKNNIMAICFVKPLVEKRVESIPIPCESGLRITYFIPFMGLVK